MRQLFIIILNLIALALHSQSKIGINTSNPQSTLDVNGSVRVGDDNSTTTPPAGTIRFDANRSIFEGYNGVEWRNFSPDPRETFWPAYQNRGAIGSYIPYSLPNGNQGDQFGYSVDIDGNYAVVGAPGWQGNRGRAFVFYRESVFGFWNLQDTIYGDIAITNERFGHSVSISGNKIVIGAPDHFNLASNQNLGQAYVFKRNNNKWDQIGIIPNSYCRTINFGWDVDLDGNQAIISSPTVSTDPSCLVPVNFNKGEVWFINFDVGYFQTTSLETYVNGVSGQANYGYSISMDNGWAVISAPFSLNPTVREDSIYIFKQDPAIPHSWQKMQSFQGYSFDSQTGFSVSIKDSTIFIGEPFYDQGGGVTKGATRMFKLANNGLWFEATYKNGEDDQGKFGQSVSAGIDFGIAAAYDDQLNNEVYIQCYDKQLHNYVRITDPLTTSFDLFVNEVSISGRNFIIGLPHGEDENGVQAGRIFFGKVR